MCSNNRSESPRPGYVVITPVRNEAEFLRQTVDSFVSQTLKPQKWVIVNDGSTDDTRLIMDAASKEHSWIVCVHRVDRGKREAGGGVMAAFYDGYELVANERWQYIVKFDGDLRFPSTYFEDCLRKFEANPKLGIGGGTCCLEGKGQLAPEYADAPYHVRGPTKMYRRECWSAIGGLIKAVGWDSVDEIKANMLGWQTRTFPEIRLVHLRPTGGAYGIWTDTIKRGLANYITGYHPVFMACKCAKRCFHKPYGVEALALWIGFLKGYVKRIPRVDDREMIRFLRRQQWHALSFRPSLWQNK